MLLYIQINLELKFHIDGVASLVNLSAEDGSLTLVAEIYCRNEGAVTQFELHTLTRSGPARLGLTDRRQMADPPGSDVVLCDLAL